MNHVVVTSAVKLDTELKSAVMKTIESKLGTADYDLKETVDPGVLGGIRLRINSRVYDATVQGKLTALRSASK